MYSKQSLPAQSNLNEVKFYLFHILLDLVFFFFLVSQTTCSSVAITPQNSCIFIYFLTF